MRRKLEEEGEKVSIAPIYRQLVERTSLFFAFVKIERKRLRSITPDKLTEEVTTIASKL